MHKLITWIWHSRLLLVCHLSGAVAEFIPRSHNSAQTVAENSANYVSTEDLLKKLPDGVKIAEDDGMIILYGVLYNNGSRPVTGETLPTHSEVAQLSDKIVSIIKEKTEDNGYIKDQDEEIAWEEVKDPQALILHPEGGEAPKEANDIIFGKPWPSLSLSCG